MDGVDEFLVKVSWLGKLALVFWWVGLDLFSKCLVEFSCEAVWSWAFVYWKISDYSFYFCACDGFVKIFYFFLVQFWKVVLF